MTVVASVTRAPLPSDTVASQEITVSLAVAFDTSAGKKSETVWPGFSVPRFQIMLSPDPQEIPGQLSVNGPVIATSATSNMPAGYSIPTERSFSAVVPLFVTVMRTKICWPGRAGSGFARTASSTSARTAVTPMNNKPASAKKVPLARVLGPRIAIRRYLS